ncbi:MAG: DNA topoisomerase VI subunit B [Candidatus Woesearchaeota archaeon]|nr:DNA topoisomerase VI subunit B [Candidatus Woesearchaeota archaeon]
MADRPKAVKLAKKHREVGVAEFFARNKHLLGFDNLRKSLLTTIKEAVDNSLDACEEADILPEISVEIIEMSANRFRVIVEDNGPGIVKKNLGKIFAKLLYGSKFHSRKQGRGQQGIGISAAVMYAQLSTGRPAKIMSRISAGRPAHYMELTLDTAKNEPKVIVDEEKPWDKEHGTRIELDIKASYQKGMQSVDEYIKETAVTNPHATIIYVNPKAEQYVFARVSEELPRKAKEIQPHPYGVEVGELIKMMGDTNEKTLTSCLQKDFSRVSANVAKEILQNARLSPSMNPHEMTREHAESLITGIQETKIMAPPTDCLSPIGEELLEKGVKKEVRAEFYSATSRPAIVVNGNPLQVEVALAFGGEQEKDKPARLMRFANRVPLLYQQGGCGITKAVTTTNWKPYGVQQSGQNMPHGALTIVVHIASVWVPFTSESKEAIANHDDIIKEVKLGLQDAGRDLNKYIKKKYKAHHALERANLFERYIPEVAHSLAKLTGENEQQLVTDLNNMTHKEQLVGNIEALKAENVEYDEEFASIGKEEKEDVDGETEPEGST